ncbi:MAG: hypothetical protein A2408_02785 [Candidatus Yonathbacteria bacterium RIFOXYC1_FULL_52_10]|uniref:Uncharacterized protein n=1 Tax=Candidatus Yonathbacteria bacterium RIFOXYD1_FULL_52_36 TaxID=1802730 RepID=A0A1G2SJX5_9BACT|nr:MAG: hypothetical protein A2408_02785 [Candidatus Yonathbacteria bacterium RIFOXYC1_FULL_52_10]OHA85032.1 MAG: hypothetical protein A2591_02325 [Candidatus Yonathbacteria bacterium RIFOXYD1_FULL_52_36]
MEGAPSSGGHGTEGRHVDSTTRAYYEQKLIHDSIHEQESEASLDDSLHKALEANVEIPVRTALIADMVFHKFADRLRAENDEIRKILNGAVSATGVNLENKKQTLDENEALLKVLETNCLKTLGPIADRVIFPHETT